MTKIIIFRLFPFAIINYDQIELYLYHCLKQPHAILLDENKQAKNSN